MGTITPAKTAGVSVLTHQAITHPDTVKGSAIDVSGVIAATLFLYHASVEATANTNAGLFLVQLSPSTSGDEDWGTVAQFQATVSTADTEAMTASEPGGETELACASTTGFLANDILYIQDTGTLADSEWGRCQEISTNTFVKLLDGLTNAKDNADVIWNDADIFICGLDLRSAARMRVAFQHEGATGANCHVKGLMVTHDEYTTA